MAKTRYNLPVTLIDLLVLRAATEGETFISDLERRYLDFAKTLGGAGYSTQTGSVRMAVTRLQNKRFLRTTRYEPSETNPGKTPCRYIEITPAGREILEKSIRLLSGPDRI
jgi:DNA-binding PadR family transcriptional regulator